MSGERIVVFAFSDVGYHCLRYLIEQKENIVACYTYPDEQPGASWPPSVVELCRQNLIPFVLNTDWSKAEEVMRVRTLSPELILSFYYRELLPASVLKAARLGAFNVHGSLLPKYRGRSPVNWAVLEGETETGATLHAMVEKADAGDIVDQECVPIGPDETAFEVQQKIVVAAVKILARQLPALKAGTAARRRQNWQEGFYRGKRTPEDGRINWDVAAEKVHNLIRAVSHPYPGAFTDAFPEKTWIWKTRLPGLAAHDAYPGQLYVEENRINVCCGDDHYVEVLVLQPEGGPMMTSAQWVKWKSGKA